MNLVPKAGTLALWDGHAVMSLTSRKLIIRSTCWLALFAATYPSAVLCAAEPGAWLTDRALEQQLASPIAVSWQRVPLSRALDGIADTQHVAIVRDRRIDPSQELTLSIDREPLSAGLARIATHVKAGYAQLGAVAYLGPEKVAQRIASLAALRADEARQLPADTQGKLVLLRTWEWPDASEPRALLAELGSEAGIQIVNPERIPHDLWPAAQLPLLSWVDRLTLLAAQFGLTYRFVEEGRQIELVDIPDEVLIARTYQGGRNARNLARKWQRELPQAKFEVEGEEVRVLASLADHEQLERRLKGTTTRKPVVTKGPLAHTLTAEKVALDRLVDEKLAPGLGLEFVWDRAATTAAGIASDQLISVRVDNVSLDDLLEAVFKDTGLQARRQGKRVVVRAQP